MVTETMPDDGLSKDERRAEAKRLREELTGLQMKMKDANIPMIVLIEGWNAAGKGYLLNELIERLDPRFISVFSLDAQVRLERYPFQYPFYNAIPENGRVLFMDSGWMEQAVRTAMRKDAEPDCLDRLIASSVRMERQLTDEGYVIVKLFIDISRRTQKKRMEHLLSDQDTAWRVTENDLRQNRHYDTWESVYACFMDQTGGWNIISGESRSRLRLDALRVLCGAMRSALQAGPRDEPPREEEFPMSDPVPRLADADLSQSLTDEEYKTRLREQQRRIHRLHNALRRYRIPMVVAYEGWDAAGKGGNIRRLSEPLDPRGFTTWPIAAPAPGEKARHFLWRFWQRLPPDGHVAIFDRTWYGRVMVERLEGFCTENAWRRAYAEINEFEQELVQSGAVVLKFWIQIDSDTQLARFTERQNTPEKQWKITDEDWRNREKWPQYEQAVSEMLAATSTAFAPWHIIESNDKKFARVKALRIVADAMEQAIRQREESE